MRRRLRWLPNAITIARLAGLPVLLVMVLQADGPTYLAAGILFAILAFSDLVDGFLARALNAQTTFGRIADPLA
ncbi:MAG: CDP-alcohol phosphatidyltransferase family protein, partial [Thermoleophilia bacterium]